MRLLTLTLAFTCFFCTCGRAQGIIAEPLKFDNASIAFIKRANSGVIDSITISTSIDKVPYGFAFSQDTLLMSIEVLLPVDELTIETFTNGSSYGKQTCWVDPPSADVYLSVIEGGGLVDSVGLSQVDSWYRAKVKEILSLQDLEFRKYALGRAIIDSGEDLVSIRFIEAYLSMPNLTPSDAYFLWQTMDLRFTSIRNHPDFQRLLQHAALLAKHKPAEFKKLRFQDVSGRLRQLPKDAPDYFLLEIYQRDNPISQQNHRVLKESQVIDSLLQKVPMISLTSEESHALWGLYVKDGGFKWRHGLHVPDAKTPSLNKWAIFPNSTYLLVDKKFRLIGVYPNLQRMAGGVYWHTKAGG
jgi:hypothetical protein